MGYYCKKCHKRWSYPLTKCIFCGESLEEVVETVYQVIGSTQIHIPSTDNEQVPYYNYLLEDKNGHKIIIKSFETHDLGDVIDLAEDKIE